MTRIDRAIRRTRLDILQAIKTAGTFQPGSPTRAAKLALAENLLLADEMHLDDGVFLYECRQTIAGLELESIYEKYPELNR